MRKIPQYAEVSTHGAQTIYDEKTFNVSPIIPDVPSGDHAAVNKQWAVLQIAAALVAGAKYKGVINCAGNPNYPAALSGDYYKIGTAGLVGGASGDSVQTGDMIFCLADTAAGTKAAVGANWNILQFNLVKTDDLGEGSTNLYHTITRVKDIITALGAGFTGVLAGSLMISAADNNLSWLPGNITAIRKVLIQTGTGAVSTPAIWEPQSYQQIINVAKSGADFTTIQAAINYAVTLTPSTSNRYCVKVAPGIYIENVTGADWVDIQGSGRTNTIINCVSGTAFTFPATKCTIMDIGVTANYAALGVETSAVVSGCTDAAVLRCDLLVTKTSGVFIMHGVKITGGSFRMIDSYFTYIITGAAAAALEQSAICQTGAATLVRLDNCEVVMTCNDVGSDLVLFETLAGSAGSFIIQGSIFTAINTGTGSYATGLWIHGTATGATISRSRITLSAPANTYGYYIDSDAGGAVVNSRHNEFVQSGAGTNYFVSVDTGDTLNSAFDKITAAGGNTGAGAVNFVYSKGAGTFDVSGTITAPTFAGNASTANALKHGGLLVGGTTNYTLTDLSVAALVDKDLYLFKLPNADCGAAPQLTLTGSGGALAQKPFYLNTTMACVAGSMKANGTYLFEYNANAGTGAFVLLGTPEAGAHIADASSTLDSAISTINAILVRMENWGMNATS